MHKGVDDNKNAKVKLQFFGTRLSEWILTLTELS